MCVLQGQNRRALALVRNITHTEGVPCSGGALIPVAYGVAAVSRGERKLLGPAKSGREPCVGGVEFGEPGYRTDRSRRSAPWTHPPCADAGCQETARQN